MTCPQCGGECERDEVDNGVGMEPCGPWGCPECHWVEGREPSEPSGEGKDVFERGMCAKFPVL